MEISLVFVNKEFGKIRVAEHNGAAWFVGSDVCDCLEIGNSRDAVASLQDDEKGVAFIDTLGHDQEISTISESGLYSLVFRSSKPEAANAFRRWIVHKVLPTIRKTGCHGTPQAEDEILSRAIAIAANRIGLLSQEVAMLQEQNRASQSGSGHASGTNRLGRPEGRTCRSDYEDERMRFRQSVRQNSQAERFGHRRKSPLP